MGALPNIGWYRLCYKLHRRAPTPHQLAEDVHFECWTLLCNMLFLHASSNCVIRQSVYHTKDHTMKISQFNTFQGTIAIQNIVRLFCAIDTAKYNGSQQCTTRSSSAIVTYSSSAKNLQPAVDYSLCGKHLQPAVDYPLCEKNLQPAVDYSLCGKNLQPAVDR